jgi:preprotein translocase subunit YajC
VLISPAYAQGTAPAGSGLEGIILMIGMFVLLYFLMIRPQMKRAKEHRALLAQIAKGDEVVTSGGLLGRVDGVSDTFVTVEIAEGVRVKLQKQAISAVLPKGTLKAS